MALSGVDQSDPSIIPLSRAGTISPPGNTITAAPNSFPIMAGRPTERNFNPLKSPIDVIALLNQSPPGPMTAQGNDRAFRPVTSAMRRFSSASPSPSIQRTNAVAFNPPGTVPARMPNALLRPYQYDGTVQAASTVPVLTPSSIWNAGTTEPAASKSILSLPPDKAVKSFTNASRGAREEVSELGKVSLSLIVRGLAHANGGAVVPAEGFGVGGDEGGTFGGSASETCCFFSSASRRRAK